MRERVQLAIALAAVLLSVAGESYAQSVFGKNKVVYADRQWQVLQEDMVNVYFYREEEELARHSLAIALEAYEEFSAYFRYEFESPIPIILYGTHHDFKQTNVIPDFIPDYTGGFTEFAKGRVAIPATGSYADLKHVLRHELVHAFMLAKLAKVMGDKGMYDYNAPPLWFTEGLAENVARRRPDTQAVMTIRDAVINDGLFPIPYLWQIAGSFLMYKEGETILGYLRTQYGDDIPTILLEAWWRGRTFEEVLELELGLDYEELSRDWQTYLKRRYYPEMLVRRSPHETGHTILEESGMETLVTVLGKADDTLRMAVLSGRSGLIDLYSIESDAHGAARLERLVEGGRKARFESLPAFRSRIDSHDGKRIAFVAKHGGDDAIFVYDLERRKVVHELAYPGLRQISSPAFSADGSRLAFSGLASSGYGDIYVAEIESGALTRITNDPYEDIHPDWHPREERLVFASDRGDFRGGSHSLYTLELIDPEAIVRLTSGRGDDNQPLWAPDGESILFLSDRSGTYNLHLLENSRSTQLTNVIGGITSADWIPGDEHAVVASVFDSGRFSLFRFPLNGVEDSGAVMARSDQVEQPATDALPVLPETEPKLEEYNVSLGLDFVQSVVALDPDLPETSGANFGFTDLLGDHQLFVHFSSATQEFSIDDLNVGVSYSDLSRRWNRHFGLFRLNTLGSITTLRPERIETRTGGFAGLTYPFSTFDRAEFTGVLRHLERQESFQLPGEPGNTWLASGFVSYVHDNTLWTWSGGPMKGSRTNLTVGKTFDLRNRGFDRYTVQLDMRKYFALTRSSVFATRFVQRNSFGSDSQFFYAGGPNDLRGYDRFEFFGENLTLFNAELRLPLVERIALRFPFARMDFPSIRGYLFSDTAKVSGDIANTDWIGSFGWSLAMTLYPPLVFRVDFVRTTDYNEVDDLNVDWNLSFLF